VELEHSHSLDGDKPAIPETETLALTPGQRLLK